MHESIKFRWAELVLRALPFVFLKYKITCCKLYVFKIKLKDNLTCVS